MKAQEERDRWRHKDVRQIEQAVELSSYTIQACHSNDDHSSGSKETNQVAKAIVARTPSYFIEAFLLSLLVVRSAPPTFHARKDHGRYTFPDQKLPTIHVNGSMDHRCHDN
jgi:hypothetical protein